VTKAALAVALVCAVVACGDDAVTLRPVIDVPPNGSGGYPFDTIDELVLSVAESGDIADIQLARSAVDDPPTLSQVPFGDELVLHMSGQASGIELAYGRSCTFAVPDPALDELHLYFSRIVKWGPVEAAVEVPTRVGGYGYAIGAGSRAVFLGGGVNVQTVEVFDALATGEFTSFPTDVPARRQAVLAPFGNGRALLVGGVDDGGAYIDRALLVDPTGTTLQLDNRQTGPLLTGHAAATLVDGTVVVAGGDSPDGVTGKAWRFRTVGGSELDVPDEFFDTLSSPRADHTMTRLGSEVGADVLIVGGRDDANLPVAPAELFRPLSESFEDYGARLIVARWGHRAVRMPGGFVLIIGGYGPAPVTKLELYDPSQGVFLDAGEMPAGAGLNELTVTLLRDGRVLLVGGFDETGVAVATAHIARLDPIDGRVVVAATDAMVTPRAGHTAVELCDGTILVVGGTDDTSAPAERYNPPSAGRR